MWKILGVVLCTCALALAAKECTISLPEDLKGSAPVIFVNGKTELFNPTEKVTTFTDGTTLHLVCSGKRNFIKESKATEMDLRCKGGKFVDANNNVVDLKTVVCHAIPASKLKVTTTKCGKNKGVIYESGIEVYNKFHKIFEICYDIGTETTIYTHNTLHGSRINYNIAESSRPRFDAAGMKSKTRVINDFYKQTNQIEIFEKLFGKDQTLIDKKNYLSRGHLSPDADFMFGYEQFSTYYYTNVAPQYQPVNAGNWLKVEDMGRSLAGAYGDDIESYNGYMGIVDFPIKGKMVKVYLDNKQQFYIPKYYFKVLQHKPSNSAIVLLSVNNPFDNAGKANEFCTNVCDKAHMNHPNFADASKGYTFCCALDDFKKSFDALPKEVTGKNLLLWKENTTKKHRG